MIVIKIKDLCDRGFIRTRTVTYVAYKSFVLGSKKDFLQLSLCDFWLDIQGHEFGLVISPQ